MYCGCCGFSRLLLFVRSIRPMFVLHFIHSIVWLCDFVRSATRTNRRRSIYFYIMFFCERMKITTNVTNKRNKNYCNRKICGSTQVPSTMQRKHTTQCQPVPHSTTISNNTIYKLRYHHRRRRRHETSKKTTGNG